MQLANFTIKIYDFAKLLSKMPTKIYSQHFLIKSKNILTYYQPIYKSQKNHHNILLNIQHTKHHYSL